MQTSVLLKEAENVDTDDWVCVISINVEMGWMMPCLLTYFSISSMTVSAFSFPKSSIFIAYEVVSMSSG